MIRWVDGRIRTPSGHRARQLPARRPVWSSALWVQQDGTIWRRYLNVATHEWVWADAPTEFQLDSTSGRIGVFHDLHFVDVDTAIALAWRHRAPDSPALVQRTSAEAPSHAQHLRWAVEEDADGDCRRAAVQEEWKPLRQRLGAAHVRSGYELSNLGRLRNANGDATRGFFFDNRRWAGTADGLIDLTTAAKLIPNVVTTTPRIEEAVEVLLGGGTPADLALRGIAHSTAWYYCSKALELLSAPERKAVGRRIVHRHIWNALLDLRGDARLGGKLNDLWPVVEQSIPSRSDILDDEHRMSHLRFGRMCMA